MESKEAYAHRKKDIPWLKVVSNDATQHTSKEVSIFKVAQKSQVHHQTQGHKELTQHPIFFISINSVSNEIVGKGYKRQQAEVKTTTLIVEIVAKCSHKEQTCSKLSLQTHINKAET